MTQIQRTTNCEPITSEMTWLEILAEFRKIERSNDDVMTLLPTERSEIAAALSKENDEQIISSFPPNLSSREFKERLYFARYGEHLPDDFFDKFPA